MRLLVLGATGVLGRQVTADMEHYRPSPPPMFAFVCARVE